MMKPRVIAHRGDSAHRPENTLASFQSAIEVGAELIELDVQLTRDGHVIVMHDATVDRTTNGTGKLADITLAELRALSAGYPQRFGNEFQGERVPTLAEVLSFLRGRAQILIEIKSDSVSDDAQDGIEARMLHEVRKAEMLDGVGVLSFDARALTRCREQQPDVPRGAIFYRAEVEEMLKTAAAVGARMVMPEKGALSAGVVARIRAAGLKIATWVVDDPAELSAFAAYDLYGYGSNCPGALLEALQG
jgi:glycerophosphoryl diester phosphodiesterase